VNADYIIGLSAELPRLAATVGAQLGAYAAAAFT
jgi:hypothetical protein